MFGTICSSIYTSLFQSSAFQGSGIYVSPQPSKPTQPKLKRPLDENYIQWCLESGNVDKFRVWDAPQPGQPPRIALESPKSKTPPKPEPKKRPINQSGGKKETDHRVNIPWRELWRKERDEKIIKKANHENNTATQLPIPRTGSNNSDNVGITSSAPLHPNIVNHLQITNSYQHGMTSPHAEMTSLSGYVTSLSASQPPNNDSDDEIQELVTIYNPPGTLDPRLGLQTDNTNSISNAKYRIPKYSKPRTDRHDDEAGLRNLFPNPNSFDFMMYKNSFQKST